LIGAGHFARGGPKTGALRDAVGSASLISVVSGLGLGALVNPFRFSVKHAILLAVALALASPVALVSNVGLSRQGWAGHTYLN